MTKTHPYVQKTLSKCSTNAKVGDVLVRVGKIKPGEFLIWTFSRLIILSRDPKAAGMLTTISNFFDHPATQDFFMLIIFDRRSFF